MEYQAGTKPNPDPTVATNDAVERAVKAERDWVEGQLDVLRERLLGIDRATELRLTEIVKTPQQVDEKIGHLAALTSERFASIANQLQVAEAGRVEQKADSKTGLDAALAAQKEAAREQNISNTLAITKSEASQIETINKLAELVRTQIQALSDKIDDLKERASRMESEKVGRAENQVASHATVSSATAIIGAILAAIVLALGVYAAVQASSSPTPANVTVETPTTP